jgi:glycogen debranching enzyme
VTLGYEGLDGVRRRALLRFAPRPAALTAAAARLDLPSAGVPWPNTPFGRDGLITALECLRLRPVLARGMLSYVDRAMADAGGDLLLPKEPQGPAPGPREEPEEVSIPESFGLVA